MCLPGREASCLNGYVFLRHSGVGVAARWVYHHLDLSRACGAIVCMCVCCVSWSFNIVSEQAQSCSCSIEISDMYVYIYIYMWPYVNPYAHARWYVMWVELSVDPFLNHSNQLKPTLKVFEIVSVRFGYYLTFNLQTTALLTWRK